MLPTSGIMVLRQETIPRPGAHTPPGGQCWTDPSGHARVDFGRGQDRTLRGKASVECAIDGSPNVAKVAVYVSSNSFSNKPQEIGDRPVLL